MTNYEKIMAGLTIEVLAEQMEKYITCEKCEAREFCHETKDVECNKVFEMWLEKEADEMKNKEWIKIFVEERDAVVQTFDIDKFKEFYAKWKARGFYDIDLPSDEILEISLRKMAYHSTKIPENVRKKAEKWLLDRGYTTDMY